MPTIPASDYLDLGSTLASAILRGDEPPWLVLPRLAAFVARLVADPPPGYRVITAGVIAAEGVTISGRAELVGPAVLGSGSEIRIGAFIREHVLVGSHCVVGNSTELKNCILLDHAQAPHFNYVGDSVLGRKAHLGAGAILSNLKSDQTEVHVRGEGGIDIPTGLFKFGAILGDGVELGCNSVCYPGSLVGRGSSAYPLSALRGIIPADSIVKADGSITPRSKGERR
jgi:NDP-sugar pyrophosphorylase family protein